MQGPEAQNIAHRHQKYDQAFFFFSIKCNDFSTVLEIYFEIHRGGTPRGEDFVYYDSMIQCTNVLQKQYHLSPKITMCGFS